MELKQARYDQWLQWIIGEAKSQWENKLNDYKNVNANLGFSFAAQSLHINPIGMNNKCMHQELHC